MIETLVVTGLATWLMTHLVLYLDGPNDYLVELRTQLDYLGLGALLECFWCMSVWMAVLMVTVAVVSGMPGNLILIPAASGLAVLLEQQWQKHNSGLKSNPKDEDLSD